MKHTLTCDYYLLKDINDCNCYIKINGQTITARKFAWDECHKIYLVETEQDKKELIELEYKLFPIEQLPKAWEDSCSLRFISHGNIALPNVVNQCEEAVFE